MTSVFDHWLAMTKGLFAGDLPRLGWVAGAFAVVTLAEVAWPAERGQSAVGRIRNLVYAVLLVGLGFPAWSLLLVAVLPEQKAQPDAGLGQALLACLVALVVIDLIYYWYHRAQHRWPWLWRVHELHHADSELNITTSMRTYWLDLPLQGLVMTTPAIWLVGPDADGLLMISIAMTAFLLLSHANLRMSLGPLTPLVVGPQLHRIHHSIEPRHRDRNFAQFFPIIDVVFGTYCAPRRGEFPRTGTDELPSDAPFWRVLVRPFVSWVSSARSHGSPG